MSPKKKPFDCVEMKRKGALKVYEATQDMPVAEEVEYWRGRTVEARRWLQAKRGSKTVRKTAIG